MGIRDAYLEGNLTAEPEARPVGDWTVIKFSIACNESVKKGEVYEDKPHFFNCEYWTKKPQYWLSNMQKGKGVVCKCVVEQDRWENETGKHSAIKFKLVNPPVLRSSAQNNMDNPKAQETENNQSTVFDDEIPF